MSIKNIIREIIKESLFYNKGIIPDMAGKLSRSNLKKNDYLERGKINLPDELRRLIIKFIKINYPNELDSYSNDFMYKLNNSFLYLSEDDLINYDSIFLKAVNNNDKKSIELANKFLSDVENDSIRKPKEVKSTVKKPITSPENLYNRHIKIINRGEPRLKDMKDMLEQYRDDVITLKYSIDKYGKMGLSTEKLKMDYNYFKKEIDTLEFKIVSLEKDINKSKEVIKNLKR
jgi:hypothetical protein